MGFEMIFLGLLCLMIVSNKRKTFFYLKGFSEATLTMKDLSLLAQKLVYVVMDLAANLHLCHFRL